MKIKPYSSAYPTPENYALDKFPAAILYFHWDDVTDEQITAWNDRCGVAAITPNAVAVQDTFVKDADGVHATVVGTTATQTLAGLVIPQDKYLVLVAIGHNTASNGVVGLGLTIGDTASESVTTTGVMYQGGVALNTAPSVTVAATNEAGCQIACYDMVFGSTAKIDRVVRVAATSNNYSAVADSTSNLQFPAFTTANALNVSTFLANDGRSTKIAAVFLFSEKPSKGELLYAANEMRTTGELYRGWVGKT